MCVCVYLPVTIFVWPFPRFSSLNSAISCWLFSCCVRPIRFSAVAFFDIIVVVVASLFTLYISFRRSFWGSTFFSQTFARKFSYNCCPKHTRWIQSRKIPFECRTMNFNYFTSYNFLEACFFCCFVVRVPP